MIVQPGEVKDYWVQMGLENLQNEKPYGLFEFSKGTFTVDNINPILNPLEAKTIIGYLPGDPQLHKI